MFEDEIQCLGTRTIASGLTAPLNKDTGEEEMPFLTSRSTLDFPLPVIMLSVEKWRDVPARSLVFKSSESLRGFVHVGRPRSDVKSNTALDGAWFRCPVVSRNHAKIKFEDGQARLCLSLFCRALKHKILQVYLIDLKSYHGTHVRKPWETSSTQLAPFSRYALSTGDEITFGKAVGTNDGLVLPVVAHVSLIQTLTTVQATPTSSPPAPLASQHENRRNSGCYGIHNDNVSSTSASSNNSDSDIEEIPKSSSADPLPEPPQSNQPYFNLFRQLLPPKTSLPTAAASQIPCVPRAIPVQSLEDATATDSALQPLHGSLAEPPQPENDDPESKEDSVGLVGNPVSPSEMISSVSAHPPDSNLSCLEHHVQNTSMNVEVAGECGRKMTPEITPAPEEVVEGNLCVTSMAVTPECAAQVLSQVFGNTFLRRNLTKISQSEASLDNVPVIEFEESGALVNSKTEADTHKAGELQQDDKDIAQDVARSTPGGIGKFISMEELQLALAPLRVRSAFCFTSVRLTFNDKG
jgi:pSer/pThr/pTyr-binding forkhead associated (FHA) protein